MGEMVKENKMSKGQKVGIRVVFTNKHYICISNMFFFFNSTERKYGIPITAVMTL